MKKLGRGHKEEKYTSIIIHGLAEPLASTPEWRKQEDEETTHTLLHSLNLDNNISLDSVIIIRLGRRPETADAKLRLSRWLLPLKNKSRVLSKANKNLIRR